MAITHHNPLETASAGLAERTLAALKTVAGRFRDMNAAVRAGLEARRLNELSDSDLARMGLKRDEIVNHVFRKFMDD